MEKELHTTLKEIVTRHGESTYDNPSRIIGLLKDYSENNVESRFINVFQTAANEDIWHKVISLKGSEIFNIEIEKIKNDFTEHHGYNNDVVNYIFDSVLFSIGLIKQVNSVIFKQNLKNTNSFKSQIELALIDGILTKDESLELFKSAINFNITENEAALIIYRELKKAGFKATSKLIKLLPEKRIICSTEWIKKSKIIKTNFNGNIYEGDLKNTIPHGKGKISYSNGDNYKGEFKKGKRHGEGVLKSKSGIIIYKGHWQNDEYQGKGELKNSNGVYIGYFENGKKHGFGTMKYTNGNKYTGKWKSDLKDGNGKMLYKNGDVYEGYWKNGERHGKGKYKTSGTGLKKGIWKNDNLIKEFKSKPAIIYWIFAALALFTSAIIGKTSYLFLFDWFSINPKYIFGSYFNFINIYHSIIYGIIALILGYLSSCKVNLFFILSLLYILSCEIFGLKYEFIFIAVPIAYWVADLFCGD